jgi:membrane protein
VLRAFRVPIGWTDLLKRTAYEVLADNCLGLAAQLAYYFFLALFPALLFVVALASFLPIAGLMDAITAALARVAPQEVIDLVQGQLILIAKTQNGGLLTLGFLGTLWSTSSGLSAVIDTLNQAYDVQDSRPFWKTKLIAVVLTLVLAVFIVVSFAMVMIGPTLGAKAAGWLHLGPVFVWTWTALHWPLVFALVTLAIAVIYYYAPDVEQEWIWITPGSVLATLLWIGISLGFRYYVTHFGAFNATYGAIGGVIVALLWFYVSALAVLVGAELNAEIEHASPWAKAPGEKRPGERRKLGPAAARAYHDADLRRRATPPPSVGWGRRARI